MTDYLEFLLDQADACSRETADEGTGWNAGTPAPAGRGGKEAELRSSAGGTSVWEAANGMKEEHAEGFAPRGAGIAAGTLGFAEAADIQGAADGLLPVWPDAASAPLIRLEAGSSGQTAAADAVRHSGAGPLYEQLVRSRAAAAFSTQGAALAESSRLERAEGISPSAVFDIAELDKVFQRDARRYDGGFSLF